MRSGPFDLRTQVQIASTRKADTPMQLALVDVTRLFSLRENAIGKEPGLGYPERWRCVSRLGLFNGG